MFIILYVSWYVIRNINMFISLMYITQNVSWYVIRKIKCVSLYVTMYVILSITQNVSWFMIHTLYVLGHFFPRLFFCWNLVFRPVILHWNFGVPLMEAKNLPRQKFGFMVLPERILRSRIRNFLPFQNSSLLLEFFKKAGGSKNPLSSKYNFLTSMTFIKFENVKETHTKLLPKETTNKDSMVLRIY